MLCSYSQYLFQRVIFIIFFFILTKEQHNLDFSDQSETEIINWAWVKKLQQRNIRKLDWFDYECLNYAVKINTDYFSV